ncbi:MAG: alpha/beta hydrolase [Alphaproteobacteria bacterium]|nr:alpha/beta hydrolase [Alphaproteobacteria bacterium]
MTLNPALEPILQAFAAFADTDWSQMPVDVARGMMNTPLADTALPMRRVDNLSLDLPGRSVEARLYVPNGAPETPPLIVYFHGGGWVLGSLDTHDTTCRELAEDSSAAVLSIDYRLAPEARYPAAAEDCYDATCWARDHAAELGIDGTRLAVAGDSAGGNLAAAVSLMARDRGGPALRHQLLIYPVTDADFTTSSYIANGSGAYFLSTSAMRWFWQHYLGGTAPQDAPLARVLHTSDLAGLAPATVITAQYDPLRDEGDAYAQKLAEAGVATDHHIAPGMIHGFFGMTAAVPDARPWVTLAAQNLAKALA